MQSAQRGWSGQSRILLGAPAWARRWWRSRARPIPFVVAAAMALVAPRHGIPSGRASTSELAMAEALRGRGYVCTALDVTWLDPPQGFLHGLLGRARALVRAARSGEPNDLYLIVARRSPEGALLSVEGVFDITETSAVDESRPLVRGRTAVYSASADGLMTGLHVLDLEGEPAGAPGELTGLQRAQIAIANLQQTGQRAGIGHTAFVLDPVARRGVVDWRADGIVAVHADEHVVAIDPFAKTVVAGGGFVRAAPDERARPGNLATWAVDRVRALSWFGDEKMQWVKAVAFTIADALHPTRTTADDVRTELGLVGSSSDAPSAFTDPDTGWPPAPMAAAIAPALPGEGRWIALDRDPFITPTPSGAPPALVTSFLRPDTHRPDVRVYVTLWDPRQIALHIEAGTVEPISATGEHGPGLIPRTPEILTHVVAAFNGGFQAQHGEYGMVANGIEYLPPKPYAATVVEMQDGSNGFGAWPAAAPLPENVIAMRQNLTALVQDDRYNPWGRTWWGGTPPGWPDQVHSTRSAVCLTKDGFAGYFYSTSISAEDLAQGMLRARCTFGIHLDMNPGHAGFEFYDVQPPGTMPPLGRRLQSDWEAEGSVSGMAGYTFRSRRMIRVMGHMLFPRYIQREARDFFYLTSRAILPGAPIPLAMTEAGVASQAPATATTSTGGWRTQGLPQHGFPYALATTMLGPQRDRPELRVLRVDPRATIPADRGRDGEATILALTGGGRGGLALWWSKGTFSIAAEPPVPEAVTLLRGSRLADVAADDGASAANARAAVGVQDEDGMLAWVELPRDAPVDRRSADAMDTVLRALGCSSRMSVGGDAHALLGGVTDLAGAAVAPSTNAPVVARLVRDHAPDAHLIFNDTPIVPLPVWQPLQALRVRYFIHPANAASRTPSASATGASATGASATQR